MVHLRLTVERFFCSPTLPLLSCDGIAAIASNCAFFFSLLSIILFLYTLHCSLCKFNTSTLVKYKPQGQQQKCCSKCAAKLVVSKAASLQNGHTYQCEPVSSMVGLLSVDSNNASFVLFVYLTIISQGTPFISLVDGKAFTAST
jgi:hypothetical protein